MARAELGGRLGAILMRARLFAGIGSLVVLSCLAPDIEIVTSLGGAGGLGNVGGSLSAGGAVSSGGFAGTSNPITCPPELPPQITQFPCTQAGLTCDYGATHCVCQNFLFNCTTSGSGGAGNGGAGGTNGGSGAANGGSTTAGNGGASPGGAAGTGGTGGVYVNPCGTSELADSQTGGGYWLTPNWHGYAFTIAAGDGTQVAPAMYAGLPAGEALCACGTVAASYEAVAAIGVNVNQAVDGSTPLTAMPVGIGIGYTIFGFQPGMRLELHGPNGATNADERWCVDLLGPSDIIEWNDFQTECWTGLGTPYVDQPLREVLVMVPGDMAATTVFDFCVTELTAQ